MMRALNRQIPWVVMLLFATGAVSTLYLLYGLSNDLALQAGVLSSGEIPRAEPFVFRLKVLMTLTLAAGFGGLLILSRQTRVQEVYVERMKQQEKSAEADKKAAMEQKKEEWIDDLLVPEAEPAALVRKVFERLCQKSEAVAGAYYIRENSNLVLDHHYALALGESQKPSYEMGEGLVGQAAKSKKSMVINEVPENSLRVVSGLGNSAPRHLLIFPVIVGDKVAGVTEIGTFTTPDKATVKSVGDACNKLGAFLSREAVKNEPAAKSTRKKS